MANGAALVQTPLLRIAGALYRDDHHNQVIRKHYTTSFSILADNVPIVIPKGGFFLWYNVPEVFRGDDVACARDLYANWGVKAVPGSVMAQKTEAGNPAAGYLRLAIVHGHDIIRGWGQAGQF